MDWLSILTVLASGLCEDFSCLKTSPWVPPPEPPAIVQPVEEKTIQATPETKCTEVWEPETGLSCAKHTE